MEITYTNFSANEHKKSFEIQKKKYKNVLETFKIISVDVLISTIYECFLTFLGIRGRVVWL